MNETTDGFDQVRPPVGTMTAATGPGTLEPTVDPQPAAPEWQDPAPAGPRTWTPAGTTVVDSPLDSATPVAGATAPPTDPPTPAPPSGWLSRVVRGRPQDPAWVRPALVVLLVGTGFLYLWGLGASGWGNSFYSAAVQAGTKSWKAFFFGSSDASNFITVDKPPGSLWVMEISARIFGVNSWSILVPQALEGVATVGVIFVTIRRWFTPGAALLAGGVVALTPVATLMFRFNNPDALLTLLLSLAAYATFRAVEDGRSRWMVLAGALVGFGFITKMLQAIILIPVLALVYLLAGPPKLGRRVVQVVYSGVALVLAGGWWVAAVQLTPAADRPYIGGSTDNNLLNLIFGYNGFGRLTGNETGSVGGGLAGGGTGSMWGPVGWNRLFLRQMGGQISWLIPGALIGLVAVLWLTRRAPRTDRIRAGFLVFGGWLLLTGATISFAHGIIHPYYTVALAPAIGALVGMGGSTLWRRRSEIFPRVALALAILASVAWAFVILGWSPDWYPALRWVIVALGAVAALGIALVPKARGVLATGLAGFGIASIIAAPAAYSLTTAATPHSGAIPSAGPAIQGGSGFGGPGGFRGPGGAGALGRNGVTLPPGFTLPNGAKLPKGLHIPGSFFRRGGPGAAFAGGPGPGGAGGFGGGFARGRGGRGIGGFGGGATGGLLNGSTPGKQLTEMLSADASRYAWVAATTGSNTASGYQLASGDPVMAIGGFNGTDPAPTLAQFETYVSEGKIHYYISGGGFGGGFGGTGSSDASQIASWVTNHFTATTVDGVTLYNLTAPAS
jgi:4-amino-4-deoxy-L-arabinose transferase-like glycosyltransferase